MTARHPRRSVLVLTTLALLACAAIAHAETVRGRVVDPQAQPLRGADVLISQRDVVLTTAKTDGDGRFGPVTLPPGTYDVRAAASGLGAEQRVTLPTGGAVDLKLAMALTAVRESVVVSAAQVDVALTRAPGSVTVIDRDEIDRRQLQTAADALRSIPGFGVVMSGSPGGVTSIFPRGGESNYTLVLVDGIVQNGFGGDFDAAHLATADVERIEVVRGPQSALFGGGAIGGVVQIITRHGGPMRGQLLVEGGSNAANHVGGSATGSRGPWRWSGAFDRSRTDGDTRVFASAGGHVSNAFYDRLAGSGSLGWSDSPARSARLDIRLGRSDRGSPGAYGSDPLGLFGPFGGLDTKSHGTTHTVEVGGSATFGGGSSVRHQIQGTWAGLRSQFFSVFDLAHPSDNDTHRATGRYQADVETHALGVSAGAEALHERANNTFVTGGPSGDPVPVVRQVAGLFVEVRPNLGARGTLTAGARVERIERRALPADVLGFSDHPELPESVVWSANPRASFSWILGNSAPGTMASARLHASVGTGIRPPTAFELTYSDNPNLKPERSRSVDGGFEIGLAKSRLALDVTGFRNRYDDLIVTVGVALAGPNRYRTDNIANALSRGAEIALRWQGPHGLSARVAGTLLRTRILGVDGQPTITGKSIYQVGDPLVRRPRQQGQLEIGWVSSRATAFLEVGGRGRMPDVEPNTAGSIFNNPGYTTVALGGCLKIGHGLEVVGRLENALNAAYEEVFGYPALGRAVWVGLRVAASR